ncbi:MAG TPA: CoA transferase, partial [Dehalococcoidia bacterium]|nr:CoA transferase [Dehalococcoidia bacterium]
MPDTPNTQALHDIKVLDLMWVIAGPTATRYLADYGATVVRVESSTRVETGRTIGPFHGGEAGPENSALFSNMNTNKYGLTLDLASSEGKTVIKDLVQWADIVSESFSPGAMYRWGLDYDALRQIKPDLIMLSTCLFGQTGPLSSVAGFGTMGSAIAG